HEALVPFGVIGADSSPVETFPGPHIGLDQVTAHLGLQVVRLGDNAGGVLGTLQRAAVAVIYPADGQKIARSLRLANTERRQREIAAALQQRRRGQVPRRRPVPHQIEQRAHVGFPPRYSVLSYSAPSTDSCRLSASTAARRVASTRLDGSARPWPAMSYAVP